MHCRGFPWRFVISWDKRNFFFNFFVRVSEFTTVQHIVSQNFQFIFYKILIWKILEELNAILQVMFDPTRLEGDATNLIFRLSNFSYLGKYSHLCKLFSLKYGLLDSCFCLGQSDSSAVQDKARTERGLCKGELIPQLGKFPRKPAH